MEKTSTRNIRIDGLLVLLLFGIFAICILMVLLSGANVYQRLNQRDSAAWEQRTSAQYLATKVRQAENGQAISVESRDGIDTLCITADFDGEEYMTLIYCYQGWLRELFTGSDPELYGDFDPELGEKVLELSALELSLEQGLLCAQLTTLDGQRTQLLLSLRGEGGGAA